MLGPKNTYMLVVRVKPAKALVGPKPEMTFPVGQDRIDNVVGKPFFYSVSFRAQPCFVQPYQPFITADPEHFLMSGIGPEPEQLDGRLRAGHRGFQQLS